MNELGGQASANTIGQVFGLFDRALDLDASARADFVLDQCADPDVRAEVLSLLDRHERLGSSFLNPLLDAMMAPVVTPEHEPSALKVGDVLKDRYVLETELHSGMSLVYRASDRALPDKRWVVKVLRPGAVDPIWFHRKFRDEIALLTKLDHGAIVAVADAGELPDGRPFFVMPYVNGVTLKSEIDRGPIDAERAVHIVRRVADALSYAHDMHVLHLDVKPTNIMLAPQRDGRVWLMDFGIAMFRAPQESGSSAGVDRTAGTPGYMAREHRDGNPGTGSDVFSLAVVAFEMLTARRPNLHDLTDIAASTTGNPGKTRHNVVAEGEDRFLALPHAAKRAIGHALDPDDTRRIDSPSAFATELERALSSVTVWQRVVRAAVHYYRGMPRLGRAALLAILTAILILTAARAYLGSVPGRETPTATQTASVGGERLDSVDALRQSYQVAHGQFRRNIQLQVLFVLIGAVLVWRAGRRLRIPLFGVTLSTTWICFVLPVVLVVLWLDFGFMLDDLIKWRAEAWTQMASAGSTTRAAGFNDSGFIDGWFMSFRPGEHIIKTDFRLVTIVIYCLTYGFLLAANHTLSIMLLWFGSRWSRHDSTRRPTIERLTVAVLPGLSASLILLSHVQFRLGGRNPNWLQEFVGGLVLVFAAVAWWHVSESEGFADDGDAKGALTVAAIGDSLTTGFCVSSVLAMIWRARRHRLRSWFADRSGAIESLAVRLSATRRITFHQFATVAANVTDEGSHSANDWLLGTRHFSEQVSSVRALGRFPDIVLLWIGHNSLDWAAQQPASSPPDAHRLFTTLTDVFIVSYRHQLRRLVDGAGRASKPVAIVVFGLVDFGQFFVARESAEQLREDGSQLYPRLEDDYRHFTSMRPEYRQGMIVLARMMNSALERMITAVADEATFPSHVTLRYSDALHNTDISSAATLSEIDGWHPSRLGHSLLARSAHAAVEEVLSLDSSRDWVASTAIGVKEMR